MSMKQQAKKLLANLRNGEKLKEKISPQADIMFSRALVEALPLGYSRNLTICNVYIQSLKMRSVYEMKVVAKEFDEFCKRAETIIDQMNEIECMN